MHTFAHVLERSAPSPVSLKPRPDQMERWVTHETPVPFEEAAQRLGDAHRHDGHRDDVVAHQLRTWAFGTTDGATMAVLRVPFEGRPDGPPLALREQAFAQLCTKIGTPAPYMRSLPLKLQIACMNWGMVNQSSPALLRLAGDEVRAVLSDRYAAIDDAILLELLEEALVRPGFSQDARVRAMAVGPHTVLRITLPGEGVAVRRGDIIEHGIDIGNSELGLRSVQVTPVTHRVLCENGMRAWDSGAALRVRHIGDPNRLRAHLRDAIPVALAAARDDLKRWKRAVETMVDSALEEIDALRLQGLTHAETLAIGQTFVDDHGLAGPGSTTSIRTALNVRTSAFDLANGITATARRQESVQSRLRLEEAAHRYLRRAVG